jgi:hypothetical protein
MGFQTDGNSSLQQQELQLQALEAFFVEVIDFQAGQNLRNDVVTKDVTTPPVPLRLKVIQNPADVAAAAGGAQAIVFDRVAFVAGQRARVIGFRPA